MKVTPSEAGVLARIALLIANNCDADETLEKLIRSLERGPVRVLGEAIRASTATNKMAMAYIEWAKNETSCQASNSTCRTTDDQPCTAG